MDLSFGKLPIILLYPMTLGRVLSCRLPTLPPRTNFLGVFSALPYHVVARIRFGGGEDSRSVRVWWVGLGLAGQWWWW